MDSVSGGAGFAPGDDDEAPGVGLGDLTGRQIGRYLIGQRIGSGGVATVYRAYDQVQGVTVALKVLQPTADLHSYDRFKREALTAGALRHPNIVRILQVGAMPQGEVAYIAMELVEGESLADLLSQRGSLHWDESCALLAPIADALALAHKAGIVHRDVKPSNILLRPAQRGAPHSVNLESLDYPVIPLLSDFGIARTMDAPELTSAGRTVGTPAYMAPEQASASRGVDGRADIYALGTVLYRCITGRLPFSGSATQILHAHVYEPLLIDSQLLGQLPPDVVRVLQRTLAKNPAQRFANADELAAALERLGRATDVMVAPHDPNATLILSAPDAPISAPPRESSTTTVLVPGIATMMQAGSESAPQAAPRATTMSAYVPSRTASPPPPIGGDGERGAAGGRGGRRLLIWLAGVAGVFLVIGFLAGFITLFARSRGAASNATPAPLALTVQATPSPTPTASPTPTRIPATATPAAAIPPPNPQEPAPTAPPTFVLVVEPSPAPATPQPVAETPTATALPIAEPPTTEPTFTPTWTPAPAATSTPVAPAETSTAPPLESPTPVTETPAPPSESTPSQPTPSQPPAAATPPAEVPSTPQAATTPGPGACAIGTHPLFVEYIATRLADDAEEFACALGEARLNPVEVLPFQNGTMLRVGNRDEVIVSSLDGRWQFVPTSPSGEPAPTPEGIPEGLYLPTGAFLDAWSRPGIGEWLGYALSPATDAFGAVEQNFAGGTLVGDVDTGAVFVFGAGDQQ